MSREFGSYCAGYLHSQIEMAADDLEEGRSETTRRWSPLMRELYPVMWAICSDEAGDADEASSIMATLAAIPKIKEELHRLEAHFSTYQRVAEAAIRNATESSAGDPAHTPDLPG